MTATELKLKNMETNLNQRNDLPIPEDLTCAAIPASQLQSRETTEDCRLQNKNV